MRPAPPALTGMVAACLAAVVITGCSTPAKPHPKPPRAVEAAAPASYYVALGDSLSKGVQPDAKGTSVETADGYANQLFTALHQDEPALRLADFGCPGGSGLPSR